MYTNMTLKDGERVPFASYRCKATTQEVRKIGDSTYTHRCRLHIDHDGEHSCICGRHWEPLQGGGMSIMQQDDQMILPIEDESNLHTWTVIAGDRVGNRYVATVVARDDREAYALAMDDWPRWIFCESIEAAS